MPETYFGGYDLTRLYSAGAITLYSKMMSTLSGMGTPIYPHHPLQCGDENWKQVELDEDGMRCPHASVGILDDKLQAAINFSITELIMELVREKYGDR